MSDRLWVFVVWAALGFIGFTVGYFLQGVVVVVSP